MYPAWRYHATEPAKIISGPHEEAPGWTASPADHGRVPFVQQHLSGRSMDLTPAPVAQAAADAPVAAASARPRAARAAKTKK